MVLQRVQSLNWAAAATDPPKLRSLLLFPDNYKRSTLHAHPEELYAVSQELGDQEDGQYVRFSLYGNSAKYTPDTYQHASQQLLSLNPSSILKGSAIPHAAVDPLTDVLESQGWVRTYCQPCCQYTCSPDNVQEDVVSAAVSKLPEGFVLGELTQDDAALVDELWTFRWSGSISMVKELIASSHTSCIRTQDGSPAAWMVETDPLCGGMLHVLDEHRQKGLAKIVSLDLFSKLQKKWQQQQERRDIAAVVGEPSGHGVYCYVVEGNAASMRLMEGLRLQHTGVFTWVGFEKKVPATALFG